MEERDLKIFTSIPTLQTERLTLRRILSTDIEDVYSYASDPSVSRYLLWYPHSTRAYTAAYLRTLEKKYRRADFFDWGVTLTDTGRIIGTCGFTSFDIPNNSAEIGYVLNSSYWGRGIASEAARAVITFGFEVLKLNRIEARFMVENASSRKVLEKCLMQFEGVKREAIYAKGRYIDVETYALTANDYKIITKR